MMTPQPTRRRTSTILTMTLSHLGQHGLDRHPRHEVAARGQVVRAVLHQRRNELQEGASAGRARKPVRKVRPCTLGADERSARRVVQAVSSGKRPPPGNPTRCSSRSTIRLVLVSHIIPCDNPALALPPSTARLCNLSLPRCPYPTTSYDGHSLYACLTACAAASSASASRPSLAPLTPLRCRCTACDSATSTDCSARPMRSLAWQGWAGAGQQGHRMGRAWAVGTYLTVAAEGLRQS